ncbi:MAG: ATP-binding cassette domain-containing protein [Anaerolineae bacterium]|nr:ATP-binding cassette domain-containing protein [Anaerolineae bacterium]MCB9103011.1 ATP-binding cassette domain-containing protein [Anaerolineales bacterium]
MAVFPEKRFFVPEVIQTSQMDCGPASLKALLEGFGIAASYGRLREACQTSVDGTSIDTLEELMIQLGLEAEQIMLPADHVLLSESEALPAIIVVRLPNGLTHFVVAWSCHANWVQVMDPGAGRQWKTKQQFLRDLFLHRFPVPAEAWRDWAGSPGFLQPLQRRMRDLNLPEATITQLTDQALEDPGWRSLAALDAATRMAAAIIRAGGLESGEEAGRVIERSFLDNRTPPSLDDGTEPVLPIPALYWSVTPVVESYQVETAPEEVDDGPTEQLLLHGAVLVRVTGRRAEPSIDLDETIPEPAPLPPELAAILEEPPVNPVREVWRALGQDGLLTPAVLAVALFMATLAVTIQALLFQGALRLSRSLNQSDQYLTGVAALFIFLIVLLLLEWPIAATTQRLGRRLETRLRIAFLQKIPRLSDRYFHSRLTSDMTQRAYDLRQLRTLPSLGVDLLRLVFQLILTTIGVIILQPSSALLAVLATVTFVALSWLTNPILEERDLRLRSHTGALSRFYLDALLGLIPLRLHGAERAFRREHEGLLVEWIRAGQDFSLLSIALQGVNALLYTGFVVWITFSYIIQGGEVSGVLLLFYWALSLPLLGQRIAEVGQQYPTLRNRVVRILEPLGAPDEVETEPAAPAAVSEESTESEDAGAPSAGVKIELRDVAVQAGGHVILQGINLTLNSGDHLAIVGPSGAGKSSLVGLLLGWHKPAGGDCLVDGEPLRGPLLRQLRRQTAWVDPAVQLWNRSLLENLTYGNGSDPNASQSFALEAADLYDVVERLENGLQTPLGEGGGLVSGGEGQRVRLGRVMNRSGVRLVVLDEPFRGLDREKRRDLLTRVRRHWRDATLICITHDVGETQDFERVIVVEQGQIIEDGPPQALLRRNGSRYQALLKAEEAVQTGLWQSAAWRRLWLEEGRLTERDH